MILPERRIRATRALLLAALLIVMPRSLHSQESSVGGVRRVVTRVPPLYPSLARSMNIRGNVKVAALVVPNGTVKSVEVKGGHPILAQAAQDAVRRWKWEPLSHATTELIEIKFEPQ